MNYQEALAYLYSLSDFERSGQYTRNREENLPREAWLLEQLGNPQHDFTSTLIAGTKGKGSTAAFIERVLRQAGHRTGLYTQPDLHTFRERIRVNGQLISEQAMSDLMTEIRTVVERIQQQKKFGPFITYEVATALSLLYFTIWSPAHTYTNLEIPLLGEHQLENATTALATLEQLRERDIQWDEEALRAGFRAMRWSARIEVIGHTPTVVVDGAHNADSIQKLLQALRSSFTYHRLITVLGPARDKDLVGMARALADSDIVVLTRMANPRAATIEQLESVFAEHAPDVRVYTAKTSSQAMKLALDLADDNDLVCATGSLYLAAEVLRWSAHYGNKAIASAIEGVDHEP